MNNKTTPLNCTECAFTAAEISDYKLHIKAKHPALAKFLNINNELNNDTSALETALKIELKQLDITKGNFIVFSPKEPQSQVFMDNMTQNIRNYFKKLKIEAYGLVLPVPMDINMFKVEKIDE